MKSFQPNCTFPTTIPCGFVQGPNIRGTADIVWGCLSVVILSTWSVLHLNVPPDIKAQTGYQEFRKQCYLLGRKLAWMGIMLSFPEYVVALAATNLFVSWANHPRLKKLADLDGVRWSLKHTVLANMGGIAVRFPDVDEGEDPSEVKDGQEGTTIEESVKTVEPILQETANDQSQESQLHNGQWSGVTKEKSEAAHIASRSRESQVNVVAVTSVPVSKQEDIPRFMLDFCTGQDKHLRGLGDIVWKPYKPHILLASSHQPTTLWVQANQKKYNAEQVAPLHGNVWVLDSKQLALAREHGILRRLSCLEKKEINDKSNIDGLIRLISVVQATWLVVELIARRIEGIPETALEISTVAFAACAILIYGLEWAKPYDVTRPFYVDADTHVSPEVFSSIAEASPVVFLQARRYYICSSCVHQVVEGTKWRKEHIDRMFIFVTIAAIMMYGGVHLFAWNLDFPTPVERLLW